MKKFLALILAAFMMLSLAACNNDNPGDSNAGSGDPQTAFAVYMVTDVGGVRDESFNQSAWEGLSQGERDYQWNVKYLESKQESDYGPNIEKLCDDNPNLIWGIGFMMADAVLDAANSNPGVNFAIVDNAYDATPSNLTGVVFRAQEPSFLAGYIAARTTKTGKVGFVGGISGVVIDQFEFGYKAGVAYANREQGTNVEVEAQYANSFSDDAAGKIIAQTMYLNGCDIVFHAAGNVGKGVAEAAKENNKYFIGVDRDQVDLAPDNTVTSVLKLVGSAMEQVSKRLQNGEKIGGQTLSYGIKENAAGYADNDTTRKLVSPDVLSVADALSEQIASGAITVPYNQATFDAYVSGL